MSPRLSPLRPRSRFFFSRFSLFPLPRTAVLAAAAWFLGGCYSFVFVDGPPRDHQQLPYFDCASNYAAPVADTAAAAMAALNVATTAAASQEDWERQVGEGVSKGPFIGLYAVTAGVAVISAVTGYTRVSQCRSAKRELEARILRTPPGMVPGAMPGATPSAPGGAPPVWPPSAAPPPAAAPPPSRAPSSPSGDGESAAPPNQQTAPVGGPTGALPLAPVNGPQPSTQP